jgi:GAF domain-containing protein
VDKKGIIYDLKDYSAMLHVLKTGQTLLLRINDPKADKAEVALMKEQGIFTSLAIPLKTNKQVLGFCEIYEDVKPRDFTAQEIRFAESLASKAAIALENAHLYKNAQNEIVKRKRTEEELEQLVTKLETALFEVKTLKGFIPICASCKKIRDDSGYWNQIELYIERHSEAEFSHSMCPDCSNELYGKENWYIKKMKEKKQTE